MQSDARLTVYKIHLADSFLSTDRGRFLYWVDAALGTLNWALLPEGDHQQPERCLRRQQAHPERPGAAAAFPDAADCPARLSHQALSVDHMLGPSFVSGGQQVFEFVRMMAHKVYLLANASGLARGTGWVLENRAARTRPCRTSGPPTT